MKKSNLSAKCMACRIPGIREFRRFRRFRRIRRFSPLFLAVVLFWVFSVSSSGQHMPFLQYMDHPWVDSVLATLTPGEQMAQTVWMRTGTGRSVEHYIKLDRLVREYGIGGLVFEESGGGGSGRIGSAVSGGTGIVVPGWGEGTVSGTTGSGGPEDRSELGALISYYRSISRVPLAVAAGSARMLAPGSPDAVTGHEDLVSVEWTGQAGNGQAGNGQAWTGRQDYPGAMALEAVRDEDLLNRLGLHWSRQMTRLGSQVLLEPVQNMYVGEALRQSHRLLSSKYQPGAGASEMERMLGEVTGFSSMIGADAAKTAGLAACFETDVILEDRLQEEIGSRLSAAGIDEAVIRRRARMVLAFKYWAGLAHGYSQEDLAAMNEEFNDAATPEAQMALVRDLWAGAITVLNDRWEELPLKELDQKKIACLSVNRPAPTPFQLMAENYTRLSGFSWLPGQPGRDSLPERLAEYDVVLAGVYWPGPVPGADRGILAETEGMIRALSEHTRLITVWFGPPGALEEEYAFLQESDILVVTYEENVWTGELAAQLIFGGIGGNGRLPVSVGTYPAGSGIRTEGNLRLQYALPENAGLSSAFLDRRIDSIVGEGLEAGAYPGCEVMLARDGRVIFHRTYGSHTYDRRVEVEKGDLYDLASVTKVSAPLAGLMVLEGMDRFSHTGRLGAYTSSMRRSDKADLPLKDILAHQAGLYPWIPYWQDAVRRDGEYRRRFLRVAPSTRYSQGVADHLFLRDNYRKKIYRSIRKSELGEKRYVYSGLSFFIFPEIIGELSGRPYEDFLKESVYRPLGAWDLTFNPLRFYPASRIVPTEYDSLFRKQQIHGYVHDEGAAMMGGYSGNAGLFSTANDLMKLFEMYRRMGTYGGEEIIPGDVLREYTSYQFPELQNRRGLGFDKPLLDGRDGTPQDYPCPGASPASFGHSGFTGTFAWADPALGITYVFLSNRVYPTRENNLLSDMNIRTSILQVLYDAIEEAEGGAE